MNQPDHRTICFFGGGCAGEESNGAPRLLASSAPHGTETADGGLMPPQPKPSAACRGDVVVTRMSAMIRSAMTSFQDSKKDKFSGKVVGRRKEAIRISG